MSSLKDSYRRLTDATNQGIFTNEEWLLSLGRVFEANSIENIFGSSAIVEFVLTPGDDALAISRLAVEGTSEQYKIEFFGNTTFTGGTPIAPVNQFIGYPRAAGFTLLQGVPVTDDGIPGSKRIVRGTAGQGNQDSQGEGESKSTTIISPNTSVLIRVTNQGAAGEIDFYARAGELPTD